MSDSPPPASPGVRPPELSTWKDIAAYLRTSVRTVQRWEEQNGLPVHRVMREKRAAIFAYPHELDAWLAQRTLTPTGPEAVPATPPSPAAPPVSRRRAFWVASPILLGFVIAIAVAWVRNPPGPTLTVEAHRLTSAPGFELHPAQSPDGAWLAYAWSARGENGIAVRSTTTAETITIGQHPALSYSPQWSPDGNSLLFLRRKSDQISELMLYNWARRTGPTAVAEVLGYNWYDAGVHSYPAVQWTPDGREALIRDQDPATTSHRLLRLHLDTAERTSVFTTLPGARIYGFALAPDGAQLAIVIRTGGRFVLHTVPLDSQLRASGPPVPVPTGDASAGSPAWSPQGDLYFVRSQRELWQKSGSAPPFRIPVIGEWPDYSLSVTRQGGLLWSHLRMDAAVWLFDLTRQQPVKSLCDSTALDRMPRISPDGKHLLFLSEREGPLNLWTCEIATETARPLTRLQDALVSWGQWSPDGSHIAYTIERGAHTEVRVMRRDGAPEATLASGPGHRWYPVWSPRGDRVYYLETVVENVKVHSARVDGTDGRVEVELPGLQGFALRPDGRWWLLQAANLTLADHPSGPRRVVASNVAELAGLGPDGRGIYVSQRTSAGVTSNYTFALVEDGHPPRQLAGATPEGMGFQQGPPGFALYTRNSDANGDIFRGELAPARP